MSTTTKLKTIKLQGKDYAQVNERIKAFHNSFKNGSIVTEPNLNGEIGFVKAIITPDIDQPSRQYVAHSYGALKGVKAFEKLETVAVGRALAYLGFSIDGSIASAEEMDKFEESQEPEQADDLIQRINQAKTADEFLTLMREVYTTYKDDEKLKKSTARTLFGKAEALGFKYSNETKSFYETETE